MSIKLAQNKKLAKYRINTNKKHINLEKYLLFLQARFIKFV